MNENRDSKMNVYLFYVSNNRLWRYFPNSVLALANPLIKAGFNPVIVDTTFQPWSKVPITNTRLVGFSIYTDCNISTALNIAKAIRNRDPSIKFVWGGAHVIMLPEQTIQHPLVDFACYAEGEASIVELSMAIERNQQEFYNVPGIIWKDSKGKIVQNKPAQHLNMDEVELYPYHLLDDKIYSLKYGKMYYEASRGCPYRCKFCNYDHTKWRSRSPEKVIEDLVNIEKRFFPQEIQLIDANHFINSDWVEEIWTNKIERGLRFRWETNCRFDTLSMMKSTTLEIIKKSGCYQLRLGAESGSQKVLDYLGKEITVEQITTGIERCWEYAITPVVSFMMGYPIEDKQDLQATTEIIDLLREKFPGIQINGMFQFLPYPNTKIFEEISKNYKIPQPINLPGWAKYQIIEFHRSGFPWLDRKKYRTYVVLNSIVSYIFFADKLIHMPYQQRKNIPLFKFRVFLWLFKALDRFIRNVFVALRWNKRITWFPAEWYLWNFLRKRVLKLF